jgi:sigma-B regulation protein RsbU (phosphoserine phosphatase)
MLGLFDPLPLRDRTTQLAPGDTLVAHTDGVTDARDERGEFLGEQRYLGIVRAHGTDGATSLTRSIEAAVDNFQGAAPSADDLTIVSISRAEGGRSA